MLSQNIRQNVDIGLKGQNHIPVWKETLMKTAGAFWEWYIATRDEIQMPCTAVKSLQTDEWFLNLQLYVKETSANVTILSKMEKHVDKLKLNFVCVILISCCSGHVLYRME